MADAEEMSLEETNKLRASLGIALLEEDHDGAPSKDEEAELNYIRYKEEQRKKIQEAEIKKNIQKSQNRKFLAKKLEGKSLGETDADDDSALSWVKKTKKREKEREKELVAKKTRELAEQDDLAVQQYTSDHLAGLRIAHDISNFEDIDSEQILTLKDSTIFENEEEGDQLTSVALEDKERLLKNLENKKKKPGYNAYDDEEFTIGGPQKREILSQYDDDIEGGKKNNSFMIGSDGQVVSEEVRRMEVSEKLKQQAVNLNYDKMKEIRDYYTREEADTSFKKPKKKKKEKKVRKKTEDEEDGDGEESVAIQSNSGPAPMDEGSNVTTLANDNKRSINFDGINFVDDDDLQQALARARRLANKKKTKFPLPPLETAELTAAITNGEADIEANEGLVISETSEFVNSLSLAPMTTPQESQERSRSVSVEPTRTGVTEMEEDDDEDEEEVKQSKTTTIKDDIDVEMRGENETGLEQEPITSSGIEEEPLVSQGLLATLALLRQKGVYQPSVDQATIDKSSAEQAKWLAEQRKKDLQRDRERDGRRDMNSRGGRGGGGGGGGGDRNRDDYGMSEGARDRQVAREWEDRMKNYKPEVKLEYVDGFGREMTAKEAFKQLSHKFHGKQPGKNKTEKRLRKLEEERKLNAMSSSDTPLNLSTAFQERSKELGAAYVTLSVGNRSVLPPNVSLSDIRAMTGTASVVPNPKHMKSVPVNAMQSSHTGPTISAPPMMNVNSSLSASEGRQKITFGLGGATKRKAGPELVGDEAPALKKEKR